MCGMRYAAPSGQPILVVPKEDFWGGVQRRTRAAAGTKFADPTARALATGGVTFGCAETPITTWVHTSIYDLQRALRHAGSGPREIGCAPMSESDM